MNFVVIKYSFLFTFGMGWSFWLRSTLSSSSIPFSFYRILLYFMTLRQRCTTASATAAKKSSEKLARADLILRQSKEICVLKHRSKNDVSSTLCDFQIFRVVVVDFLSIHSAARWYDRKATATVYCNSLTNSNQFSIQRCAVVRQTMSLLA